MTSSGYYFVFISFTFHLFSLCVFAQLFLILFHPRIVCCSVCVFMSLYNFCHFVVFMLTLLFYFYWIFPTFHSDEKKKYFIKCKIYKNIKILSYCFYAHSLSLRLNLQMLLSSSRLSYTIFFSTAFYFNLFTEFSFFDCVFTNICTPVSIICYLSSKFLYSCNFDLFLILWIT